jgi:hypothetical protein
VGAQSIASNVLSTALGTTAVASGPGSTAIAPGALASGAESVAIGLTSTASGEDAIAIGGFALASGDNGVAVGFAAIAAEDGVAVGLNSSNGTFSSSVALGAGSVNTADNQVNVGGRTIGGLAAGVAEDDAVNVAQLTAATAGLTGDVSDLQSDVSGLQTDVSALQSTSDTHTTQIANLQTTTATHTTQIANLQTGLAATNATVATHTTEIADLQTATGELSDSVAKLQDNQDLLFDLADRNRHDIREANEGVAMALAMDSPNIPAGAHFALSGGVGYFKGRGALATAISAAVSEMSSLSAGVAYGFRSKEVGARAGFQLAW